MHTMQLRESRSSLAGVVMAIAAEGIALEQVERLASHGLPGGLGKALHGVRLPKEAQGLRKAVSAPAGLEHKLEHKAGVSPASLKHAAGAGAVGRLVGLRRRGRAVVARLLVVVVVVLRRRPPVVLLLLVAGGGGSSAAAGSAAGGGGGVGGGGVARGGFYFWWR